MKFDRIEIEISWLIVEKQYRKKGKEGKGEGRDENHDMYF